MCRTTITESDSRADAKLTGRQRSNSMPVSSKVTPKASSRRVIFPTLYESPCHASPLFKNQKRELVLGPESDPSRLIPPFSQPQIKRQVSIDSTRRENSDVPRCIPHLSSRIQSSQKITPDTSNGQSTPPEKNLAGETLHSRNFMPFQSLSSISNDETDQSNKTDTTICTPKSETYSAPTKCPTPDGSTRRKLLLPPFNNLSDFPVLEECSPKSTASDLLRRLQPGPSILKNKCIHSLTPKSSYDNPPEKLADDIKMLYNGPKISTTKIIFDREKMFLRKSLSDSCLDCLKKLSSGEDCSSNDEICRVASSPYLASRAKTEHDNCGSTKSIRRFSWNFTRHFSHDEFKVPCKKRIRFDPRVWVHEVQKCAVDKVWYNESDLQRFKKEAVQRIREWTLKHAHMGNEMIPTGTGRIITRECRLPKSVKAFYTNPALGLEAEDDSDVSHSSSTELKRKERLEKEIQKVLLVDCHDIFLCLLSKDIKSMMPHVVIDTAYTVKEALDKMEKEKKMNQSTHGFDLIVVEHRLKQVSRSTKQEMQQSGSILIRRIANELDGMMKCSQQRGLSSKNDSRYPFVIGMSAYMDQDEKKLRESGCDMVWKKPPPTMNDELRDKILQATMKKR
eukprot:CAMPEP_0176498766 /NCGR_PEP_ID=MMETSP0200_2-20121128/12521_1 /TAXON_ID=947934 /ORGANISM="Chaetoceros sp., Strain GSL56" /LENGTH=620 /DNA_ID=CAMNT_0017897045 /DNA_START=474 /DNA_END=2333 /DNA_ORIENTATION=+